MLCLSLIWSAMQTVALCLESNFDHGLGWTSNPRPLVIAHRGASGVYPEHTAPAYQEGIDQGADLIECDVVISKDLVPFCFHDNYLSHISNITEVFPNCLETLHIPEIGIDMTDCFAHRYTMAELKTVGVRQRYNETRDKQYDYKFPIVTLAEFLDIAKSAGRKVGVYPELKNPHLVNRLDIWEGTNTSYEDVFLDTLHNAGYKTPDDPCIIQCFDHDSLLYMKSRTELPCVQLSSVPVTDAMLDMYQENGFYGVGLSKSFVVNSDGETTDFVKRAHARGLKVHLYTFRNDQLDMKYHMEAYNEYLPFSKAGIDGAFTDFPSTYRRALELIYPTDTCSGVQSTFGLYSLHLVIVVALATLTL